MILVTGASGLLGANFVSIARDRHEELVALFHEHAIRVRGVRTIQVDLTQAIAIKNIAREIRPDWIVHCAAATDVDWCESHPEEAWRLNVEVTRNLAAAARSVSSRLVYISTDSIFDGRCGHYGEADSPNPVNLYAKSKWAGEQAIRECEIPSLIIRSNFYGWSFKDRPTLAEWILSRLEWDQRVPGFDDVIFTPLLVNDLCEIILDMMALELVGTFHVAASQACSKYEFAVQIARVFALGKELVIPTSIETSTLRAPRPRNTSLATGRICAELRRSMPDVESGLRRFKNIRESTYTAMLKAMRKGPTE